MSETVPTLREELLPSFDAPGDSPYTWLRDMAGTLRDHLLVHGAVLVHGLPMDGPDGVATAREALGIARHTPTEAFNDRGDFGDGVLSPITWPGERMLCPFQEGSFSRTFPSVVLTACLTPPDGDGRTHLSDTRRLLDHLPAPLAERVRTTGWTLARTFHEGFGITWRKAFSVPDRAALEELFEAAGISAEWLPGGTLYTVRRRPGVVDHPVTGEECWFNQISFLNAGNLDPAERTIMVKAFGEYLPMNTYFGDGSPFSDDDLAAILHAYDSVRIDVAWRRGDLLITDNIIMAQGRSAFEGTPEFLVALGENQSPRPGSRGREPEGDR
ncbi:MULTISPECIES: TauD/TfdA family dioxygenase [Streptomyces]|uniref:SyrP n=1 Tax=Streptomyces viridochromogenes TaxID=1938 RepID=A0A0L8KYR8_STRVR|nr:MULTISPECIES: TauD/TfdA family dioxygenase [Streptomyces]KOG30990.1 SyrP [Streptomyces viridochromogenes]